MIKLRLLLFAITLIMTVAGGIMPAHAAVPQIAAGAGHTIAVKTDGTLWAWGYNGYGQLGIGSADTAAHPTPVQIGRDTDWTAVAAGDTHTLALKADGTLWAWGNNAYGRLGDGTVISKNSPEGPIGGSAKWTAVAAGGAHTIGMQEDGTLWAWGWNIAGQLGIASADGDPHPIPAQIGTNKTWTSVTVGGTHTIALQEDGTLWAWGWNAYGQLGNGSADGDSSIVAHPAPEKIGTGTKWTSVTAGGGHTIGLQGGTLWAWGFNIDGQLGDRTKIDRTSPVFILNLKKFPWPMFVPAITGGIR